MASTGETAGLIDDVLDIDALEADLGSPKLPGSTSKPRAQSDRYLAPT